MKTLIKLEEVMFFILGIYFFSELSFPWWVLAAAILLPDLGMLGYVIDTKVGAWVYNVVHHRGINLMVLLGGRFLDNDWVVLIGVILFTHSSLDRIFDYGLKYTDDFKHTHLTDL